MSPSGDVNLRWDKKIRDFVVLYLLSTSLVLGAEFSLENPLPGGYESGIGIVSGWHCNA